MVSTNDEREARGVSTVRGVVSEKYQKAVRDSSAPALFAYMLFRVLFKQSFNLTSRPVIGRGIWLKDRGQRTDHRSYNDSDGPTARRVIRRNKHVTLRG